MDHDDDDGDCYSYSGDGGDDDGRIGVNGVLLFISKTPTAVWPDLANFATWAKWQNNLGQFSRNYLVIAKIVSLIW